MPYKLKKNELSARGIVEAARNFTRRGRDERISGADWKRLQMVSPSAAGRDLEIYMELVLDSYLTGAAETLKLLQGDTEPELWADDYNHQERLEVLLAQLHVYRDWIESKGIPHSAEGS